MKGKKSVLFFGEGMAFLIFSQILQNRRSAAAGGSPAGKLLGTSEKGRRGGTHVHRHGNERVFAVRLCSREEDSTGKLGIIELGVKAL